MWLSIDSKIDRFGYLETARMMGYAATYYARKHLLRRRYMTRPIHDFRMRLDLKDPGLSRDVAVRGTREDQLRYVLQREVKSGDVILDLGANIGYYTIMLARLTGSTGHVYALEPAPDNFEMLRYNVGLNGLESHVDVFNLAGAETRGTAVIHLSKYSNLHSFIADGDPDGRSRRRNGATAEVETTDLSSFLGGKRRIDLLRMDIEGYEVEVLRGLLPAIRRGDFDGKIIFESHLPRYDDQTHSIREPLERLFEHGYYVRSLTSNDERTSAIRHSGFEPVEVIRTSDTRFRGVYDEIPEDDALQFICESGGVRDVLLAKR